MTKLLHRDLTDKIIGAYYDVYNGLSRTYPEFVYENALMQELRLNRITCKHQEEYQVYYKEWIVGAQRLDIFVAEEVVVEIKVKPQLTPLDQAQLMSYLKIAGRQVGLLLNFGSIKPEFNRLYFTDRSSQISSSATEKERPELLYPEISYRIIGGLFEVHNQLGPGFIHRIYANACYREMQGLGLEVTPHRQIVVFYKGNPVGEVKLGHLQIEGNIMVFPVAIQDKRQIELENLRRWMAVQKINLGILANFYAERLELEFMKERG